MESAHYDPDPASESYLGSDEETEDLETEEESEGEETTAETEEELDRLTDHNEEDKTKQECIISDPSFSMVTVQREDSGITWETNSSRSSTPWASESSLTSDMYSLEGSTANSPPGNISFILDEGKKVRKRSRKPSSKHGSPALRRKGGKKRNSMEGQSDVLANTKDKALISDGKLPGTEQEKSSIGTYDKTRKKKTVSNTPPITGAIYKEHKPLVLRPVYIGTVQYKIKMFNSVKEEIIPLQFYGTLPKGYVIKEINYRKGKDASITLEPDQGNQNFSIASKASKSMTENIESNKEKQFSPPWREAMSKESRPASFLKDIEKPKGYDLYSPLNEVAASGPKNTVSSYSSNKTVEPQSLPSSVSRLPVVEVPGHEIQMDSPDAPTTELVSPKMGKEELKADIQQAETLSSMLPASPSFVDEVGEEEREADLLAAPSPSISETITSPKEEEEAFELESPVAVTSAPEAFGSKIENQGLSSLEKEEPVSPSPEEKMEETKPVSSVSFSEPSALGETKAEEEDVSLPITSGSELEPSYVSEEVIEIDYPESPFPSENAIPPHLVQEGEIEAEPDSPLLATSTSENVALLEKEREEIGLISPDSDFASEFSIPSSSTQELEEKETMPVSPPGTMSASDYEVLSGEETVPCSPELTSVSEYSTISPTVEESIAYKTPVHSTITSEPAIFSEEETLESERYTPDSTSASEYSIPPYVAQETKKEETDQSSPLSSVATAEPMFTSEEEKDDIGPYSPDSAFVSEYSVSPHATQESEKEEFEQDYPIHSTSPSEHTTILTEEENEVEPFSPDSDFSIPPYPTPEPEKKETEPGSLLNTMSVSEYSIFSEAEKEEIEPETQADTVPIPEHLILSQKQKVQPSASVPRSEQLNPPSSASEVEQEEVKPDSERPATSVSEYLILSQKQKIEGPTQAFESEHSIPPSSAEEGEKEEIRSDSSVPTAAASLKTGSSEEEKVKPILLETSGNRPQESIPTESTQKIKKEQGFKPPHVPQRATKQLEYSKANKEETTSNSQVAPEHSNLSQHKEMEFHSPMAPEYVTGPSDASGEPGKKVGADFVSIETSPPQQETSLKNKENLSDIQKAKSLAGISQAETKEKVSQGKVQANLSEFQHPVLSESEKEGMPHPPEQKYSSLSEEIKKEVGPESSEVIASDFKHSLLSKVVKEEIQSDLPFTTTSVSDSAIPKAQKEEIAEPGSSLTETVASKSPVCSEVEKEVNLHASSNTSHLAEPVVLSKEEEKPVSPMPEHSVISKVGSDQGAPPLTVPSVEHLTSSKKETSELSLPASVPGSSVPPYMTVEREKSDNELASSKPVISASEQIVSPQEKEEREYSSHESETLGAEELSMKSVTPTDERSRQEPGTLMSDKARMMSEKPGIPTSSHVLEPKKTSIPSHALDSSEDVPDLLQHLVSESEHRDTKALPPEPESSVMERTKSGAKTKEEGKQEHEEFSLSVTGSKISIPSNVCREKSNQETNPFMVSDESLASFVKEENLEPQQDNFSLKELLQESRDLADDNKGEKQKGHPLTPLGNLAPYVAEEILTKTNEDIAQTLSFPMSEDIPEPSKMVSSDLSEECAKQKTKLGPDVNLPNQSIPSSSSPLSDQQDIATESHSFAEANVPLEELRSDVTIEPRDVKDTKGFLPLPKEGILLPKELSHELASPVQERAPESGHPYSSATHGRLMEQITSAPSEMKQIYEYIKQESLYPAKEPNLSEEGTISPLGSHQDQSEKVTTQTYFSPEIKSDEELGGTAENVSRPEAHGKQISSLEALESVIPGKSGTGEDGQEKFIPTSESITKVQPPVSGDYVKEQVKPEIIPSSIKTEDSVTPLNSEIDMGSIPYSSTEKRLLEKSKADTSKVAKNVDEAQLSEIEKHLPEAKMSMQEKPKLSLIQSGEITTSLSPEIMNKVPEQSETAAVKTVTESKSKKGVSSFTSWMASLFFGASAPENDADEKEGIEAQLSPAADTVELESEAKTIVAAAPNDFNEAEKPVPFPLSASGLLPEKEDNSILIKASEEREQRESTLSLPNQVDKELSKLIPLGDEKLSQKSELPPTRHLPESRLLSVSESRRQKQFKEEPAFLSAMEEAPPKLFKPISENLIEEHKKSEYRKEEMKSFSDVGVEIPSVEQTSIKVTSIQDKTCLEKQPSLLGKQLVSEEVENGTPIDVPGDNRVLKAETYTPSETSQLMDQGKKTLSPVELERVTWPPKSTPPEIADKSIMKESAKGELRILTTEETKGSLIKAGGWQEKEMEKVLPSTFYDNKSDLRTVSTMGKENISEQKPYCITERDVLSEKSEKVVSLVPGDTDKVRMEGCLEKSSLHKEEYLKESAIHSEENKEDKRMTTKIPIGVHVVAELPMSSASVSNKNQLSSAETDMKEDLKSHSILGAQEASDESGMILGSSVDESQPPSFVKADFPKKSQITSMGTIERNKEESYQFPLAEKDKLILGRSEAITVSPEEKGEQKGSHPYLSPDEKAERTNFASEKSGITFDISYDEMEHLKNQTYSLVEAKSITGESQRVISVVHPEIKETNRVGSQPTSLRETDSLGEKTKTLIPTTPGHKVEVDTEDVCPLLERGRLTSQTSSHSEKEQPLLSSDMSHVMAESSKDILPDTIMESKKQESQSKLGTFGGLVSRESKVTLDHPSDEARNLDGAPDSPFVSKQISISQTKPVEDLQIAKPFPSAIRDSDQGMSHIPPTHGEETSSTEGITKEPENLIVKDGARATSMITSKPPGLTEDQKNAFSIISEGCEILNIHAPAFISSVDEEECEQMQDKLEYLKEKTSKSIQPFHDGSEVTVDRETVRNEPHAGDLDEDLFLGRDQIQEKPHPAEGDISTDSDVAFNDHTLPSDVDYFEKYTLIDYNISPEPQKIESLQKQDVEGKPQKIVPEETISFPESSADRTLECEFDLVKLDESFYGTEKDDGKVSYTESQPSLPALKSTERETPRNVARDVEAKSPGMPLFNAEEEVLSPTKLFPTDVKAVNPELLEEPPALPFLYKDLYEEAVGFKKKEGETTSDRESLTSDASFPSRHSDADEGTGMYFEKYILKDDILHDTFGYQKDQGQSLEEIPVGKDDSCQLIASEEVCRKFGTILGEGSMEEEQKTMVSEEEWRSSMESNKDGEVQGKVPITEEVQLVSQKISYAVPFQETHHILETVDEPDGQGNEEENANPEASQHFPVEVSYPEEEFTSGATPAAESLQVGPQVFASPEMRETRPCSSPVQDEYEFAELRNNEVVTQEDLLSDDLFSESTPEDVLFQGKESFDLAGENDEFAKEVEQNKFVPQKDSGSEIAEPARLLAEVEDAQKEAKKSQIDTYCYTCKCPISAIDKIFGAHKDHEVAALDTAIDVVKIQLGEFLENLQEKSLKIEAFVTEIESFFNTIEENCSKKEKRLEEQNEEMMKKVLAQYDEKAQSFEEVKKRKMEYLHEQMVNFLQCMDTAKETLETIVKEAEELDETVFLTSFKEINDRLLSAMESTASLENIPTAFSLFEHYDDSSTRSDQMLKHVAVPQPPMLEPQEPNSATSTTIMVYWSVRKEDVVESFQVYCMEDPQEDNEMNDLVEEYRLTVKESYCLFEDLEPGRCYQVWVMAVNFTGCSLPSERATFRTAPATPIIRAEDCTVCWNTATIRWSSASPGTADAYTLEYCRQHSPEGEGLRSYSGIKGFQLKVNLQPNDNYFFYAKAVNAFGTSEQSEAALISTRGTRFLLLRESAHPALQISTDGTVIQFSERRRLTETPSVLGEQLPACGQHYWETTVTDCPAYRLGICSSSSLHGGALGQGDSSWYMHCFEPQRYTFFNNGTVSNVHVTEHPARVGILLDYSNQRLLFINAESGQLLFTIRHRFTGVIHPAFALERPGQFTLHLGKEPPDFLRHK